MRKESQAEHDYMERVGWLVSSYHESALGIHYPCVCPAIGKGLLSGELTHVLIRQGNRLTVRFIPSAWLKPWFKTYGT